MAGKVSAAGEKKRNWLICEMINVIRMRWLSDRIEADAPFQFL